MIKTVQSYEKIFNSLMNFINTLTKVQNDILLLEKYSNMQ